MKTIVYTVCTYPNTLQQVAKNLLPNIQGMEKWAKSINADFKCIDYVPQEVEDIFKEAGKKHPKIKQWETGNTEDVQRLHSRKAWSTKLEVFQDFYRSNYEKMLFLDCDMMPMIDAEDTVLINRRKAFQSFNLNSFDNFFYCNLKNNPANNHPLHVARKMLLLEGYTNEQINECQDRVNAQVFCLTKNFKHNIGKLWSYDELLKACLINRNCIREECFMTYTLHKSKIMEEINHNRLKPRYNEKR